MTEPDAQWDPSDIMNYIRSLGNEHHTIRAIGIENFNTSTKVANAILQMLLRQQNIAEEGLEELTLYNFAQSIAPVKPAIVDNVIANCKNIRRLNISKMEILPTKARHVLRKLVVQILEFNPPMTHLDLNDLSKD